MTDNTSKWLASNPNPRGIDVLPCSEMISQLYQIPHLHMPLTEYGKNQKAKHAPRHRYETIKLREPEEKNKSQNSTEVLIQLVW